MWKIVISISLGSIFAGTLLLDLFRIKSILLSEISFAIIVYLLRLNSISRYKPENKLQNVILNTSWTVIFIFLAIQPQILTLKTAENTLITFAIIGALLFAFIPQGIIAINKNYKPDGKQIYDNNKLAGEVIVIMHALIIFIFVCLL